jgi:hypothetical protein
VEATTAQGAHQGFQQGFMIWLPTPEGLSYVFAFTYDGRLRILRDDWRPGMAESDPSLIPPEGLLQPVRGFGKVWREDPALREAIGWALAPEVAYSATRQDETRSVMPGVAYLTAPDGTTIRLADTAWSLVNR